MRTIVKLLPPQPADVSLDSLLVSGALLTAGSALAKRLVTECGYPGQRPLDDDRVLLLAEAMEARQFLTATQIAFGRLGGRNYLVNGQHRLHAVDLAQIAQEFRIEIYPCETRAELDALYCRFDQPGGRRSLSQLSHALGLHDEDQSGLRPVAAAMLLRATPFLMINMARIAACHRPRATRDLDARKDFALPWKPAAIAYQACLDQGVTNRTARFRASGTVAVALATLRYQTARAQEFWMGAIRNHHLAADDPRLTLANAFLTRQRASHEHDLADMAACAWNAFMRDRPLKAIRTSGVGPIRLIGTPYSGDVA